MSQKGGGYRKTQVRSGSWCTCPRAPRLAPKQEEEEEWRPLALSRRWGLIPVGQFVALSLVSAKPKIRSTQKAIH